MNYFQDEQTAAYNRERIHEAFYQIRLEELALKSRVYRPGRFERLMFNLANWMIATGKQLRKRYEIPIVNRPPAQTKSLAR
jgi:hypothetical protein